MASIRKAQPGDEKAIGILLVKLVGQHVEYDEERFSNFVTAEGAAQFYRSRMDANDAAVLAAEIDSKVVGFAYLQYEERDYAALAENSVTLHDLFVMPEARGRKIGRALLQAAVKAAHELGGRQAILSVAAKNAFAREFFRRSGFRETMVEMALSLGERK